MLAFVLNLGAASSFAQAIPSPVLPGRIENQLVPPPAALAPALPPAPVPQQQPVPSEQPAGGINFVLRDVEVDGSTIYTPAQLKATYAQYLDKPISIEVLPQIEEAITVLYRRDGYILSRALIDAQTIDPQKGIVHVKVLEGYIDKVRLDPLEYEIGDKGKLVRSILKHIEHACRPGEVQKGDKPCPLHREVLERYLLLANDLPGIKASAVIEPSLNNEGAADLFVTIDETPTVYTASLDNRGSGYVGPLTAHQSATFNNLLGLQERSEIHTAQSIPFNELELVNGVEEIPLTSDGLRIAIDFTHTRSRPGGLLRPINLETIGDAGDITLAYPYIRSRSENLQFRASVEIANSVTTHGPPDETAFFDQSRAITLGASYDLADRYLGVNLADLSLVQGIPVLGATQENSQVASHVGASPTFTKFDGEVSRVQQIVPQWNVLIGTTGQYSFSKLLSSQQFGYGGEQYGRGYDPSEILGDRGVDAKTELQYTPDWAPGLFGWAEGVQSLQFYDFFDIGRVWVDPGPSTHMSGASAGVGVRFTITDHFAGYLEMAKPLTRAVQAVQAAGAGGKEPRFFFSVAGKF